MKTQVEGKIIKGELVLLALFGSFIIVYLIDIHDLPWEAKILSYILAPFILGILLFLFIAALRPQKKPRTDGRIGPALESRGIEPMDEEGDKPCPADKGGEERARVRLVKSLSMGCFLFLSIYFLGFYLGGGLMLLLWFLLFKRVTLITLVITLVTPLLLYLTFEVLIDFGLHGGVLFEWLSR